MLISYSKRFIFIHVYKVAGISIGAPLKEFCRPPSKSIINQQLRFFTGKFATRYSSPPAFHPHITAIELRQTLPEEIYNRFFKFAFVRNPWDWQVSLYFYMLKTEEHIQHYLTKSMNTFEEYIEWRVSQGRQLQKDFVTDDDGTLIVDFIGKYENIENDFAYVCGEIGVNNNLPHLNQSPHKYYKEYYNKRTINLVSKAFEEDIELFKYSF